jgi:hypothetical protein
MYKEPELELDLCKGQEGGQLCEFGSHAPMVEVRSETQVGARMCVALLT